MRGRTKMDKRPYVRGNVIANLRPQTDADYRRIETAFHSLHDGLFDLPGMSVTNLTAVVEYGVALLKSITTSTLAEELAVVAEPTSPPTEEPIAPETHKKGKKPAETIDLPE